jgi:hypothetical protein
MLRVDLPDDVTGLVDAVEDAYYVRGAQYARQRAVVSMRWDSADNALHGTVHGSSGDFYETTAYFAPAGRSSLEFEQGQCTCPVGFNCKHVVALVLTATGGARPPAVPGRTPQPVAWEQSLRSLLDSPPADPRSRPGGAPLAVELTLSTTRGSSAATVLARLVRPGKNGWVSGGLTWTKLRTLHYYGEYLAEHVRLLQELYTIYRSGKEDAAHYSYREEKSIDLAAFHSRQLWVLLDEADALGLRLVHARKRLGDVRRHGCAELCLDATRDDSSGSLSVVPLLRVDGADLAAAPLRFIGTEGHGVVFIDRSELRDSSEPGDWHLQLAKLDRAVPAQLQRMAMENRQLEVPSAGEPRFREEYYPRLRHLAPVISSDASFTPPTISAPTLVLHADYGTGHDLDLSWDWAYEVGDTQLRTPLRATPEGFRDLESERALLDGLGIPREIFELNQLAGIETMRFSTEVLPLLADQPGVAVEINGDRADYREAGDSLRIGVSTDDVPGETDWFDLGVTISVEGREVPFLDVFLALSHDQSHMLLADGAYFVSAEARTADLAELDRGGAGATRFASGLAQDQPVPGRAVG